MACGQKHKFKRLKMAWMIKHGSKRKKLYWLMSSWCFTHFNPLIWIFKRFWWAKWFWQKRWNGKHQKGLRMSLESFFFGCRGRKKSRKLWSFWLNNTKKVIGINSSYWKADSMIFYYQGSIIACQFPVKRVLSFNIVTS